MGECSLLVVPLLCLTALLQHQQGQLKLIILFQSESQGHLRDFVAELHHMISSVVQHFHPLPLPDNEEEITIKLKSLYVGPVKPGVADHSPVLQQEKETRSRVCATVLSSYDMSLRDTMQLAAAKLEVARTLVKQLGGEVRIEGCKRDKAADSGSTNSATPQQENGPGPEE